MHPSMRGLGAVALLVATTASPLRGEDKKDRGARAGKTVRVAGIVLKWVSADKEVNYKRAEPLIRAAAAGGAKIVCTTECFLDGYAARVADPKAGGPLTKERVVAKLADFTDEELAEMGLARKKAKK
jgi:hypothetical protein